MYAITVNNFDDWRNASRRLLANQISPEKVSWQSHQQAGLFDSGLKALQSADRSASVPAEFLSQARQAACYVDRTQPCRKWAILYSLLWRLVYVDRCTLLLKSDPEVQALRSMSKAVSRDIHKMKAFVRFQSAATIDDALQGRHQEHMHYNAWFEPAHDIIEPIAPFFVKRFTGMHWSILTPVGCAHWNQSELRLTKGVSKPDIKTDDFDDFWRAYYRSIFNPARLKEQAMQSEMPKKYWKYLPEASCIKELSRNASVNTQAMVSADTTSAERLRVRSRVISGFQDALRVKNRG